MTRQEDEGIVSGYKSLHKSSRQLPGHWVELGNQQRKWRKQMKYLSDKLVAERYGVSRATWWRWVREGNAPPPVKLSTGCTRWRLTELEAWEANK